MGGKRSRDLVAACCHPEMSSEPSSGSTSRSANPSSSGYSAASSNEGHTRDCPDDASDSGGESASVRKRRKIFAGPTRPKTGAGIFKATWKLPVHITASKWGSMYAYCKLCASNFSVSHGGFNDVKRHIEGYRHQDKLKDSSSTTSITSFNGLHSHSQVHTVRFTKSTLPRYC